ncbi:MAG: glutathione S-transferase family protein [Okeania sp. SIO2H7]|nr:glutathione S-transferase family protein [Okeania sp. SIO2H7]
MSKITLVLGSKNYSSWSLRAWLTLKQAGVDFSEITISLGTPTTHKDIRRYSPSGRVPVLLDGDLTVWDSLAICEYAAEKFANWLWPKNLGARAIARSISAEMHSGFPQLRQNMPMDCHSRYPGEGRKPEVEAEIERIKTVWRQCREKYAVEGDFLFGNFTIVDAMFAPVVSRFVTYGVKLDSVEKSYANAILALPAMQEWLYAAAEEADSVTSLIF